MSTHVRTSIYCISIQLTYLSRMDLHTLINRTRPLPILWVLGVFFLFSFSIFNRTDCEQTVKILVRHRIVR